MSRLPVVAVVGRPNVGKSTLVNRILGRKAAVVDEQSGVTRDRRDFIAEWTGHSFHLVDTGGWEIKPGEPISVGIREQAEAAIQVADVVVFVADARSSLTDDDQGIARLVLRAKVPFLFVANKIDGPRHDLETPHLWSLGLGEPIPVSSLHGRGTGDFLDLLVAKLPELEGEEEADGIARLAIVGRPNVGKSTLLNRLAGEERVLVSPVPGTTRDPIDMVVELDGEPFRVIDTAGIRRRSRVDTDVEYYSVLRAKGVIEQADVALLMIDSLEGVTQQDQRIAEDAEAAGAGLIVLLNKWDVIDDESRAWTEDGVADRLAFVGWAPVLRMSAMTGARTHRLPQAIRTVLENRKLRIPTPELNNKMRKWQDAHPPPVRKGRRPKILYAVQAETSPPTFVLFLRGGDLGPDYLRYLENRLRADYDFMGTPVRLRARRRERRGVGV